jgi:hypothetical protein
LVENRKNTFEFIGYDFMIDENLKVWLIEVNSSPSMCAKNQPILKELVSNVQTDLAKVVVDHRKNSNKATGGFEIVHRARHEVQRPKQMGAGNNFCVEGTKKKIQKFPMDQM